MGRKFSPVPPALLLRGTMAVLKPSFAASFNLFSV